MSSDLSEETLGFIDRAEEILISVVGPEKAAEAMDLIVDEFKSSTVYIAADRWKIKERNAWIKKNFKGNYRKLRRLYINKFKKKISERQLRRIV